MKSITVDLLDHPRLDYIKTLRLRAILDVGCGNRPHGSVNVDLNIKYSTHRGHDTRGRLFSRNIPNLVCADMNHLPFRDCAFDKVFSDNAIEHNIDGLRAIKEMVRVSDDVIEIKCPHRFSRALLHARSWDKKHHVSYYTRQWFMDVAHKLNLKVLLNNCTRHHFFPHVYLPLLNLPIQIHFKARKTRG